MQLQPTLDKIQEAKPEGMTNAEWSWCLWKSLMTSMNKTSASNRSDVNAYEALKYDVGPAVCVKLDDNQ